MAAICTLVQWNNVNDKDVTDSSKYTIIKQHQSINPPVVGLDEDLEYFIERTPYAIPEYDPRLVILNISNGPVDEYDTEYPILRKWETTYSITERTNTEKKISVEEVENISNNAVFPIIKQLKYLVLYAVISRREALGLSISSQQQNILDKVESKALRIWTNHITALSKKTDIDNSINIDLDIDWENTDPENE
jgi:hypothetical protein